ncbi:hypothetical protein ABIA27_003455 [Sinorhizobium fredii]
MSELKALTELSDEVSAKSVGKAVTYTLTTGTDCRRMAGSKWTPMWSSVR